MEIVYTILEVICMKKNKKTNSRKKGKKMINVSSLETYKTYKDSISQNYSMSSDNIKEYIELDTNSPSPEDFDNVWFNKGED
jgi:hypothetical protein